MNTAAVAKELGVSTKTVQRWVKQLGLPMERNELGHYHFREEDLDTLKSVREQLQNGVLLQDIKAETIPASEPDTPAPSSPPNDADARVAELESRLTLMEQKLNHKADAVVSYQLLQHRREMEELNRKIQKIEQTIDILFAQLPDAQQEPVLMFENQKMNKRKGLLRSIFSL
ncbi:MerR family transcriptional regulator [Bacillus sp. FJAT-42376]|uniref:MerR family transcriptional regulator n=1 Tax=Bacillus sp. FJAT-42376 TaxID=2014076 RepID=UPI000F4F2ACD|nr:MerR family transcriptional regulator [Bacillus sp. FJAT-42376]AZB40924.1 MerR family transcriptional regulator [Bacillus sp. FJAT-42376]